MAYKRTKIGGNGKTTISTRHINLKTGKQTISSSVKPGRVRTTWSSDGKIRRTWVDAAGYRHTEVRTGKSVNEKKRRYSKNKNAPGPIEMIFYGVVLIGGIIGAIINS